MRIDKKVDQILKLTWAVEPTFAPGSEASPEDIEQWKWIRENAHMEVWHDLILPLLNDPDVDAIAAEFGMTGEQLLEGISIIVRADGFIQGPESKEANGMRASTDSETGDITLVIGSEYFANGVVQYAYQMMLHELAHVAEIKLGTLPLEPNYDPDLEGQSEFMLWFNNPHERQAIQAEILDYLNDGWTTEQIIGVILGGRMERMSPEAIEEATQALMTEIRRVRAEGPIRITN
jgi:hypothetical protein